MTKKQVRYSVLDLVPIVQGSNASVALHNTISTVQMAERCGFTRYWVAEHHNMGGIASSATSVVIGHVAQATNHIRVGSGGIMLPNHAPLIIAEQFGTLASLYPGRVDLGIGRAPGTDQRTAYALRRNLNSEIDNFPRDVMELKMLLGPVQPDQRVRAIPGVGTNIPIWILGSSLYGAQLAAILGLPFGFASHFAPAMMMDAIKVYRDHFKPSDELAEPYVMLGYNVCAADTYEEAKFLRSSGLQSFLKMRTGQPAQLPPPIEDFEDMLDPTSKNMLKSARSAASYGEPESVRGEIEKFLDETDADELIVVCQIYEHEKRLHSFELTSEIFTEINLRSEQQQPENTMEVTANS